ncbi:hypothetical protein pipiens_001903 [Culex pipiens pipiens]|uniref:Uncharacterized protein n=1 Tax=Culex pipiens pipiens TaxID=38569 RepID=A0ABD1DQM3_CULPP
MGAKISRRSGRRAAVAVNVVSTVGELATPDETRTDETDVDRVAGGGQVDGGNASTGGIPEPDPPVSEQKLTDSCFGQSDEPADPVPEGPMTGGSGTGVTGNQRCPTFGTICGGFLHGTAGRTKCM